MIPHLDMLDLRLFADIAATNSVRRGAQRSHLSAAAASARIRHLEELLGTRLLERTNVGVTLTPPGQAFLHHARRVLLQLEDLGHDLAEYAPSLRGWLRVAVNPTALVEYVPGALPDFIARHADVRLDVRALISSEVVRAVSSGTADLGIIAGEVRTEGLEVENFLETRLALAVPLEHPLAARGHVPMRDALAYPFVELPDFSPTNPFTLEVTAGERRGGRARVQAGSVDALCQLVAAGVGIGIVPEPSALRHARNAAIRVVRLDDPGASFAIRFCARSFRELPSFAQDFIAVLKSR